MNDPKTLIPLLRKHLPALIAQDIVGVQPMGILPKNLPVYLITGDPTVKNPEGYVTVDVTFEVSRWIETQPIHMWKPADVPAYSVARDRYVISEQLYTWLTLKWS